MRKLSALFLFATLTGCANHNNLGDNDNGPYYLNGNQETTLLEMSSFQVSESTYIPLYRYLYKDKLCTQWVNDARMTTVTESQFKVTHADVYTHCSDYEELDFSEVGEGLLITNPTTKYHQNTIKAFYQAEKENGFRYLIPTDKETSGFMGGNK